MTDSPDPIRRDPSREPATIDGEATVVGSSSHEAETVPGEASPEPVATETLETTGEMRSDEMTPAEWPSDGASAVTSEADTLSPEADSGTAEPFGASPMAGVGTAPEPRRGPSFGALAASALLGGLVSAGALLAFQSFRPAGTVQDPRVARIEQQLTALPRPDALQALEGRLAALENRRSEVDQRLAAAQSTAERAAARAEEALNRPAPAAPGGAPSAPQAAATNTAATAELGNRLSALETQLREQGQAVTGARQDLEQRIAQAAQAAGEATQRSASIEQRLGQVAQQLPAVSQQVTALSQQVTGLSGRLNELRPDAIRAGLRVVLADRLNDALAQGAPFPEVLASLRQFEANPQRVAALEPLAQAGAPTAASLAQSFKPVSERILREARPEAEGIADRLLRMADKIVTVRAVDDPGSDSPAALVARIEDALARGALADAAAAWDALPESGRRASEDWGRQLKARVAAEQAARQIATDSIAALNASSR